MTKPLIYLATPYTKYPDGLDQAYVIAAQLTCRLRNNGFRIYAPIVASHVLAKQTGVDPRDHEFWMGFCRLWMPRCHELLVAQMAGWRDSLGIGMEIEAFRSLGKPIRYLECETLSVSEAAE